MQIPNPLGRRISKILLDFAERRPPSKDGILHTLQRDRERQRKYAQEWIGQTLAPPGVSLRYLQFRMIELFTAEEIPLVLRRIEGLIPPRFDHGPENVFDSPSFVTGGFRSLGVLSPHNRSGRRVRQPDTTSLTNLPEQVAWIHLSAHKIMPSMYLISADVYLTEATSGELAALQHDEYLPEMT